MLFGLESLLGLLKRNSIEKIEGGVYVKWFGNTILAIFITLCINDILLMIFIHTLPVLTLISPFVLLVILYFYCASRRAAFGVTNNNFIYIKLKRIIFKEKEVNEIPINKIRYLEVKKIFNLIVVKLYFISDIGKFKKVRFTISSFVLGFDAKEYKKNYQKVYEKLINVQKVLDKGDF